MPTFEMLQELLAQKEFELSRIEREVIKKHMFPLTPVPPLCREGLMVCLVDKGCSLYETFKQNPYPMLRKKFLSSLPLAEPARTKTFF